MAGKDAVFIDKRGISHPMLELRSDPNSKYADISFGVRKAEAVLANIEVIRDFVARNKAAAVADQTQARVAPAQKDKKNRKAHYFFRGRCLNCGMKE